MASVAGKKKLDEKRIKRLTVDLDEDLHSRFKIGCIQKGTTMNDFIRDFLEAKFPKKPKGK